MKEQIYIEFIDADVPDAEVRVNEGISILVDLLLREYRRKHSKDDRDLDKRHKTTNENF